jgi:hypothetical protein
MNLTQKDQETDLYKFVGTQKANGVWICSN